MPVEYAIQEAVALIRLNHAPVNALSREVRQGLALAIERAAMDPGVHAIVVWGGSDLFSAGADIAELDGGLEGEAFAGPSLVQLIASLEDSTKPVIAAIAGLCMGGGFELALGCHERVIADSARFALPEIHLGLMPGAGATQRLPRLIGLSRALPILLSGDTIDAARAVDLGIGTRAETDIEVAARARAREMMGRPLTPLRSLKVSLPQGFDAESYLEARNIRARGTPAARSRCLDCACAAATVSFDEGLRLEARYFKELLATSESKALRYAFRSDRRARSVGSLPPGTVSDPVRSVGVVGAGTMGAGIAQCALDAGLPTVLVEADADALSRGLDRIRAGFQNAIEKGHLDERGRDQRNALLTATTDMTALQEADLIIEAVFEDLETKRQIFSKLDRLAKPQAILASNTSTLNIDHIAQMTARPAQVLGLHFFSPAPVMRLLEIVRGRATAPSAIATALSFARRLGKTPVVARVCDGFIGNRMFEEYLRQAYFLLDEGATPWQVDAALEQWGMAMGPFAVMDLAGGDIGWAVRKRRALEQTHRPYSGIPDQVCELGRFGRKTGAGYYRYDKGKSREPDPLIDALIDAYSRQIGLARREISEEEIVERCLFALVNEGAKLLAEGIAQRASDIDVVYRNGYGFPAHRGGPLFHADEYGLVNLLARMRHFARGYQGQFWQPAPLLVECAKRADRLSNI